MCYGVSPYNSKSIAFVFNSYTLSYPCMPGQLRLRVGYTHLNMGAFVFPEFAHQLLENVSIQVLYIGKYHLLGRV